MAGGKQFEVVGAVAVIPTKDGSERYMYRGAIVSDDAFTGEGLEHVLSVGLIAEVAVEAAFPEGDPSETWKVDELKAYAESKSIDLGDASKKADILAAIAAVPKSNE